MPNMPKACYVSLSTPNPDAIKEFYQELFGWNIIKKDMGGHSFWYIPGSDSWSMGRKSAPDGEDEAISGGGIVQTSEINSQGVTVYYNIDGKIDVCMAKAESLGGSITSPKMAIPGEGYLVKAKDPDGNLFGMWENNKGASKSDLGY